VHGACDLNITVKGEGLLKVTVTSRRVEWYETPIVGETRRPQLDLWKRLDYFPLLCFVVTVSFVGYFLTRQTSLFFIEISVGL